MRNLIFAIIAFITCNVSAADNYKQLLHNQNYYMKQVEKVQIDMTIYALRHPGATAALIASGTGFAAILMDNMKPDARLALAFAGAFGIGYCINNSDECKVVARDLTIQAALLAKYQKDISHLSRQITRYRSLQSYN